MNAANVVSNVSKLRPVSTVASIQFLLRKITQRPPNRCLSDAPKAQCIEGTAICSGRFDTILLRKITQRPPIQVPECCAKGAVYRSPGRSTRSLRYNFCYAKITQRPTLRQGWERYEPSAVPMIFRPAEATGGSPTHGRARARGTRARAKPRHPPRRI